MPLTEGKSEKSFEKNIKTEINAGKPRDQALAIAYNVRKHNAKKMAHGGAVKPSLQATAEEPESMGEELDVFKDENEDFLSQDPLDFSEFDEPKEEPSLLEEIMKRIHNR